MSANKNNIEEIQAYLAGKLDAQAMHRLEREAQDDPFLMDAMEGYQNNGKDQLANFADVKARFTERIKEKKERSLILWRVLPIAASLVIVLGIGFLWLLPKNGEEAKLSVNKSLLPVNIIVKRDTTSLALPRQAPKPPIPQTDYVEQEVIAGHVALVKGKPSTADSHEWLVATTRQNAKRDSAGIARTNVITRVDYNAGQVTQAHQVPAVGGMIDRGVQVLPTNITVKGIAGKVTDATGHALVGVKVMLKGSNTQVETNDKGVFMITLPDTTGTLNIAYAGYDTKHIPVSGKRYFNIVLNESTNELAQVSVAGYSDTSTLGIHPGAGWKAFKDYIKQNAFMPDGTTGRVKLAFTVDAHGAIKGIRILHGKNSAMNQKAIALLMNGPQWMGSADAKELKLKIRFRRMKAV